MAYQTCLSRWGTLFFGFLFLAACAPDVETVVTVPVAQPTILSTSTPEIVTNQSSTPSPSATVVLATSTATSISTEDVQATITSIYVAEAAEAATLFAPTSTFTPSPTFTPVPGTIWPIFFRAIPCKDGRSTCDDSLGMDYRSAGYVINSDGSQLTPITDLGFPADFSHPVFSADGVQLAYLANFEPEGLWHLFLANADGSVAIDLGADKFLDFQFVPETDCLITARFVSLTVDGMNVAIEKRCIGRTQPQELEAITFPVFYEIHFSPQGDSLLAYGKDSLGEVRLLVHEIGGNTQQIFSETGDYFTGDARWTPDGGTIEFIGTGHLDPDGVITTTFSLIERDGGNLEDQLTVVAAFPISNGNWSPDGQEFAFTYGHDSEPPEGSGLYILDLNTGEWRQILSHFYLSSPAHIDVWKQDTYGTSE
jgi:hypothetical protein